MKQIIALVFYDILSYTIGNIIMCIFKNFELNVIIIIARIYKLWLAEANFLSCYRSQKFATQWRRRFRPHKVYIFLISINRQVDLAMSFCPSVRLSVRFYAN